MFSNSNIFWDVYLISLPNLVSLHQFNLSNQHLSVSSISKESICILIRYLFAEGDDNLENKFAYYLLSFSMLKFGRVDWILYHGQGNGFTEIRSIPCSNLIIWSTYRLRSFLLGLPISNNLDFLSTSVTKHALPVWPATVSASQWPISLRSLALCGSFMNRIGDRDLSSSLYVIFT